MDETIPVDTIIENIDNSDMRYDANVFFNDISRVSIRASFMRANRYLQVIEITLNSADHINEISFLIQKAIRYQILFVFIYEDRYLLLRRSFNLTMSTEHVYTEHASFCSDWMYKEDLDDENLVYLNVTDVANHYDEDYLSYYQAPKTDNDNGDHRYFADILGNAEKLNNATIESDFISLRFLIDWFNSHAAGYRLSIYDVLDYVRQMESYHIIGDNLFVEKNCVSNAICELENSQYRVPIGHTGKNPMFYFKGIKTPATYSAADNLMIFLLYGTVEQDDSEEDEFLDLKSKKKLELNYEYEESDIRSKAIRKFLDNKILLREYFSGTTLPPLLTKNEEFELGKRIECGDVNARNDFILANIRLVVSIAKTYASSAMELDDLIHEGMFGLFNAVDKYDRWRDNKFSTYATYWIKQSIQRAIEDKSSLIRLPVHLQETLGKMKKARNDLLELYGVEPTPDEIAVKAGMSSEKVHEMLLYIDNFIIYDEPIDNKGGTILNQLADDESNNIEEYIVERNLRERLDDVLKTLTPREEGVVRMRFGLDDGRPKTMEEVGMEFNITRERVRQIEAKALRKLRHPYRSRCLKDYLDDEPRFYGIRGRITSDISYTQSRFINDIIRRFNLRGFHIIEEAPLKAGTIRILRLKGYQVLEQLSDLTFEDLEFLNVAMRIDLILGLARNMMRLKDCSREEYPKINTYLQEKIKCVECGNDIIVTNWSQVSGRCTNCQERKNRMCQKKDILASVSSFNVDTGFIFTNVNIVICLVSQLPFYSELTIESAELITVDERCFPLYFVAEGDGLDKVSLSSITGKDIAFSLCEEIHTRLSQIKLCLSDKQTGYTYTYLFKVDTHEDFYSNVYYTAKLFDYEEEYNMTECQKCEMSRMILEQIAKMNGIAIPSLDCELDGECMGSKFSCELVENYLANALNEKMRQGEEITLAGLYSIPYENVIKIKDKQQEECDYEKDNQSYHHLMMLTLEELDLSIRTYNCLKRAGINTVSDLVSKTFDDMVKVRNLGRRSFDEVILKLKSLGLRLKDDESE